MKGRLCFAIALMACLAVFVPTINADVEPPNEMNCVHNYGNVGFCVSNWGFFGSEDGAQQDCETGLPAESFEFPTGSEVEYLFWGGLWIGGVVGSDTLVSVGVDGWQLANELYPCADDTLSKCRIEKRSTRPGDQYFHPDAASDLDMIAFYTDTLNDPAWTPADWTGRPYIPLNIDIKQHSHSWSGPDSNEFVIIEFEITSIDASPIDSAYIGVYIDADIGHKSNIDKYNDDISGSRMFRPGFSFNDTIFCAWSADNDGDPVDGNWEIESPRGVLGVAPLGPVAHNSTVCFNFWTSNGASQLDWGPWLQSNDSIFDFLTGGLGTPDGDRSKYFMMKNGEIDYDQLEAAVDHTSEGWLPPSQYASTFADGNDTRFLLSFGPLYIGTDTPARFGVVFAAGHDFHVNPTDYSDLFDPSNPGPYQESLDFSSLEGNLTMARHLYDNINMGDVTWNGIVDIDDIVELIGYIFLGAQNPSYLPVCDVNCDGTINLLDIIGIVNYVFRGGPMPTGGCID